LDVLGVHGKLVKYVVHLSKRKKLKKIYFSSHKLPKQQLTSFWSQGILGVKVDYLKLWLYNILKQDRQGGGGSLPFQESRVVNRNSTLSLIQTKFKSF
jgi:hypothetical protein